MSICGKCGEAINDGECWCPPDHLMAAIDREIERGGGWAAIKNLPGGSHVIWDLIERGFLEEDGEYVRRTIT